MVRKAIIPAAGLGRRMRPLTQGQPKELLFAGDRPMIQHVIEEASASGCEEICVVIREGKEIIRDYLTNARRGQGPSEPARQALADLRTRCELRFVHQRQPKGLGDALVAAKEFVGVDAFALLIPDQIFQGETPPLLQMTARPLEGPCVISSIVSLSHEDASYFEGARGFECTSLGGDGRLFEVTGICPTGVSRPGDESGGLARLGFGRTIFPPEIFPFLTEDYVNTASGEIDLLKTFEASIGVLDHFAVLLEGQAFDFGTLRGYRHFVQRLQ